MKKGYLNKAIVETEKYILISIEFSEGYKAGWEELQKEKNKTHSKEIFVEIYPLQENVINNANVRHLYCIKGFKGLPDLRNLENETNYKIDYYE